MDKKGFDGFSIDEILRDVKKLRTSRRSRKPQQRKQPKKQQKKQKKKRQKKLQKLLMLLKRLTKVILPRKSAKHLKKKLSFHIKRM